MNYKNFIIGLMFLIVPIVLLYMCSLDFKLKNIGSKIENYGHKDDYFKKIEEDMIKRNKVYNKKRIEEDMLKKIKEDKIKKHINSSYQTRYNPIKKTPIQIEQFKSDNEDWKDLVFFHPKNVDMNSLIATDPVHKKMNKEKDLIEGFLGNKGNLLSKVSNLFSSPNSKINLDVENHSIKSLRKNEYDNTNNIKNLEKAKNELLKLENGHINKQFANNLHSTNQNLNKKIEKNTMNSINRGMPMINAKPQASVPIKPKKPLFDIKSLDCQFFSDSCPNGYQENGFFSVGGTTSDGLTLTLEMLLLQKCRSCCSNKR